MVSADADFLTGQPPTLTIGKPGRRDNPGETPARLNFK